MSKHRSHPPKYRLHKGSGQALVEIDGRRHYLGPHDSAESRQKYQRLLAEIWAAPAGAAIVADSDDDPLTITELVIAYWEHAQTYYRRDDGSLTCEIENIRKAVQPLTELYGDTPARDFGPLKLKSVRQAMIDGRPAQDGQRARRPWCRSSINRQIKRIRQIFKWAAADELIPPTVPMALAAVVGLKMNRSAAIERPPVRPVSTATVEATIPFLRPPVAAVVKLQLLTAARPGEILAMRGRDLDMTEQIWVYRPTQHKGKHLGREREIFLGPKAQEVVRAFLKTEIDAPLFSPRDAVAQLREEQSVAFQSARAAAGHRVPPSRDRRIAAKRRRTPMRAPAERYTLHSYRQAIARACDRANVPRWHPHQLRHSRGTDIRSQCGVEVSRIILGHATLSATEIYAEADRSQAVEVMLRIG